MAGGIRSMPILETKAYLIIRELNEYIRFDKPGNYRLYVTSERVQREATQQERAARQTNWIVSPVTSNIVEFTIMPADAEWTRKELQSAETAWASATNSMNGLNRDERLRSAAKIIRFLGTEDAARYMISHMEDSPGEFGFGLMGSQHRAMVVKEMADGLDAPDLPISDWYIYTLVSCAYPHRMAPYPGNQDPAKLKVWQQEEENAQASRKSIQDSYLKRLAAAVFGKRGPAKAVSLNTLMVLTVNSHKEQVLPAEFVEKLPSELIQVFFDLPAQTQESLLNYRWSWIKGPGIMPVLERYYEHPTQEKGTFNPFAAGVVLRRIYELNPPRGRELILKEIARPTGRVRFEVLAMLPDKILPEMDELLASALEKSANNPEQISLSAQLLARYGTAAILPRIKSLIAKRASPAFCTIQASVTAYFLRVGPKSGSEALEEALDPAARKVTHCALEVLLPAAKLHACPELDAVAIRHLDDSDPGVVLDAISALGKYGGSTAEAPLWKRFEKWHDEWKDKAAALQPRFPGTPPIPNPASRIGPALREALAFAPGWLTDAEKLRHIRALCLTDSERQQLDFQISQADQVKKRISVMPFTVDTFRFEVAQYNNFSSIDELKAKLAQFPKGTMFEWYPFNQGQAEDQKKAMFDDLKIFLSSQGMSLEEFKMEEHKK